MEKVVVRLFADCKTKNQIASKSSEYQEWSIGNSKVGNFPLGRIADVLLSEYGIMRVVRVKQSEENIYNQQWRLECSLQWGSSRRRVLGTVTSIWHINDALYIATLILLIF